MELIAEKKKQEELAAAADEQKTPASVVLDKAPIVVSEEAVETLMLDSLPEESTKKLDMQDSAISVIVPEEDKAVPSTSHAKAAEPVPFVIHVQESTNAFIERDLEELRLFDEQHQQKYWALVAEQDRVTADIEAERLVCMERRLVQEQRELCDIEDKNDTLF